MIVQERLRDHEPMKRAIKRPADDPRNLGLLAPSCPASTAELVAGKKSRMGKILPTPKE